MTVVALPVVIPVIIRSHIPGCKGIILQRIPLVNQVGIDSSKAVDFMIYNFPGALRATFAAGTITGGCLPGMAAFRAAPMILSVVVQCDPVRCYLGIFIKVPFRSQFWCSRCQIVYFWDDCFPITNRAPTASGPSVNRHSILVATFTFPPRIIF